MTSIMKKLFCTCVLMTLIAFQASALASVQASRAEDDSTPDYFNPNITTKLSSSAAAGDSQTREFLGLRVQPYRTLGQGSFSDQSRYDLSGLASTVLPTLSLGLVSKSLALGDFQTTYGVELRGAYATQTGTLTSPAGTSEDAHLQTTILSLNPLMRFRWSTRSRIYTRLQAELGNEQMSLSGSGSLTSSQRSLGFVGYGLGLEWDPFQKYGFVAEYTSRTAISSAKQGWSPAGTSAQVGVLSFF
jgi:hypothetical protein